MRNKNWNTARQSTYFFLSQFFSLSPHFFPIEFIEFTPFPDFPLYKTLLSRLCYAAGPRSVNLSLPHSQAVVSDSRTQGWHCRGRVAEGLRREGGRRRERLACIVFLAGGDRKGECRRVCESDRVADEIARVTHGEGRFRARWSVSEPKGRKRKEPGWCRRRWYRRRRWQSQVVVVEQVVIVIMVVMVVVAMVAGIRLAPFPR